MLYALVTLLAVVCASVSVLGDCLSMAVIQQRPKDVLDKMDEQRDEDRGYSERIQWAQWI